MTIVVVGAGLAGLSCASQLVAAGREVLVLEARERVGGRVHTLRDLVPGGVAEAGAELIGNNHPLWLAMARRFGLELEPCPDDDGRGAVLLGHERWTGEELRRLQAELEPGIESLCRDAAAVDAEEPWRSPGADRLDRTSLGEAIARLPASERARRTLWTRFTCDMNLPPERLSYLGILAVIAGHGLRRYWTDTEAWRCRGGAQSLADALARTVAGSLRLACAVEAIEHGPGSCRVRTRGGETFAAETVVLAVPPSTWPRIAFDPPLPSELRPQLGSAVKYLAAMRGPFWRQRGLEVDALSDGPLGETWGRLDPALIASFCGGPRAEETHDRRRAFEELLPGFALHLLADRTCDWNADAWTRGGYAYQAPGQVLLQGPLLHRGLGPLRFAGEHTCFPFMGFMEGGLHSGLRVARELLHG